MVTLQMGSRPERSGGGVKKAALNSCCVSLACSRLKLGLTYNFRYGRVGRSHQWTHCRKAQPSLMNSEMTEIKFPNFLQKEIQTEREKRKEE